MNACINVIFGTDSVLWDSDQGIIETFSQVFPELHQKYPHIVSEPTAAQLKSFCGPSLDVNLNAMIINNPEIVAEAHALYRKLYDRPETLDAIKLYDGIPLALEELQQHGKTLYIVTEEAVHVTEALLERLGIRQYFTAVQGTNPCGETTTPEEITARLTVPEMIEGAHTVFVCGRERSAKAAVHSGFTVVGALWGGTPAGELKKAGATRLAAMPQTLFRAIQRVTPRRNPLVPPCAGL